MLLQLLQSVSVLLLLLSDHSSDATALPIAPVSPPASLAACPLRCQSMLQSQVP